MARCRDSGCGISHTAEEQSDGYSPLAIDFLVGVESVESGIFATLCADSLALKSARLPAMRSGRMPAAGRIANDPLGLREGRCSGT